MNAPDARLVHVLRVDLDARAARRVDDGLQVGERHADGDVDAVRGRDARAAGAWMKASASAIVLFIFQLPAMNGVRDI